ncbi:hypothetical protein [Piscinibacter sp.]|uniref:hypothetical protein n=1 Tax=Piscinibacter sp. TaxID=1903157 RepID=UPI001DF9EB79|nr:hypothetical protein [Piscinibacter sp.]MBK7533288.1 hypothetical protein [Piscinibacter sp.]
MRHRGIGGGQHEADGIEHEGRRRGTGGVGNRAAGQLHGHDRWSFGIARVGAAGEVHDMGAVRDAMAHFRVAHAGMEQGFVGRSGGGGQRREARVQVRLTEHPAMDPRTRGLGTLVLVPEGQQPRGVAAVGERPETLVGDGQAIVDDAHDHTRLSASLRLRHRQRGIRVGQSRRDEADLEAPDLRQQLGPGHGPALADERREKARRTRCGAVP